MRIEDIFSKLTFTEESQILFEGKNILNILKEKYDITYYEKELKLSKVLADWLYYDKYQNRTLLIDFKKKYTFIFNDERYSKYEKKNAETAKDKIYLKRGYDARLVPIGSFVEDDYFLNQKESSDIKKILSIYHPAYEINGQYIYIRGQEFLEVGSVGLIRFYFNLNFDHPEFERLLHELIRQFQTRFDIRYLPFYLKFFVSNDKNQFERADNFIVYAEKRHFKIIINIILEIYKCIGELSKIYSLKSIVNPNLSIFRETLPLFVKEIEPGLGFAEEPNFGIDTPEEVITFFNLDLSFGEKTCETIAEAFVVPFSAIKKLDEVYESLTKKGIQRNELGDWLFFLNPNSDGNYIFDQTLSASYVNKDTFLKINIIDEANWFDYNPFNNKKYLFVAIQIFFKILKEAVWINNEQCTFLGYSSTGKKDGKYAIVPSRNFNEGLVGIYDFLKKISSIYVDNTATKTLDGINSFFNVETKKIDFIKNNTKFNDEDLDIAIEYLYFKEYGSFYESKDFFKTSKGEIVNFNDDKIFQIADQIIDKYFTKKLPIKNGYDGSDEFSPSLNFGLAGIGHFFLTLYDSSLPNYSSNL
jgi:hypothetical protein